MKLLLMVTAASEGTVGIGLLLVPVAVVSTLFNASLDTPGGLLTARLAGAALTSIAICCWQARTSPGSTAAKGIITALLFYNIAAAAVLAYGGIRLGLESVFIWPVIVLHGALAIWCGLSMTLAMRRERGPADAI